MEQKNALFEQMPVRKAFFKLALPVVKNTCPMDGHSRRQEVKDLLAEVGLKPVSGS